MNQQNLRRVWWKSVAPTWACRQFRSRTDRSVVPRSPLLFYAPNFHEGSENAFLKKTFRMLDKEIGLSRRYGGSPDKNVKFTVIHNSQVTDSLMLMDSFGQ